MVHGHEMEASQERRGGSKLHHSPVDDARIEAQSRHNPYHREDGKNGIAQLLVVGIFG